MRGGISINASRQRATSARHLAVPVKGWIKAIRDSLGMTAAQLANRMGISQSTLTAMEKAEARGAIQLSSLRRAAEAMNCTLVYALVPNDPWKALSRSGRAGGRRATEADRADHAAREPGSWPQGRRGAARRVYPHAAGSPPPVGPPRLTNPEGLFDADGSGRRDAADRRGEGRPQADPYRDPRRAQRGRAGQHRQGPCEAVRPPAAAAAGEDHRGRAS